MQDLSSRTLHFAIRIIKLFSSLPEETEAQVLGKQLLRSGTSVGAHYRESIRARSNAEFIAKIDGGLQELEETGYWLELLLLSGIMSENQLSDLLQEVKELTAILITVDARRLLKWKNDVYKILLVILCITFQLLGHFWPSTEKDRKYRCNIVVLCFKCQIFLASK